MLSRAEEFALFTEGSQSRLSILARRESAQLRVFVETALSERPDVFLDIGANIGAYASVIARRCPGTRVHAFEASPATFNELAENVRRQKLSNVQIHQVALSSEDGVVEFLDVGHLAGASAVASTATGVSHAQHLKVQARKLDDILSDRNLTAMVKLDVEGHEIPVIEGASSFLRENDCVIQVEFLSEEGAREGKAALSALGYMPALFIHNDYYFVGNENHIVREKLRSYAFKALSGVIDDYLALAEYAGAVTAQIRRYTGKHSEAIGEFPRVNFPVGGWL